ncbi:MAG: hypothetical protein R3F11_11585 [Verrucomicrobiales bacterium]
MIPKAASALIVLFWLAMTAMLVRITYFPDRYGINRVPPETVLQAFLAQPEPTDMMVRQRGKIIGKLQVFPELATRSIKFAGEFDLDLPGVDEPVPVNWGGALRFGDQSAVESLTLRIDASPYDVVFEVSPSPLVINFRVMEGKEIISDQTSKEAQAAMAQAQLMLMAWGINPNHLTTERPGARPADKLNAEAWEGRIELEGQRHDAYVFEIVPSKGMEFTLFFNKAGQPLALKSFLDYEMIADTLLPRDEVEEYERRHLRARRPRPANPHSP